MVNHSNSMDITVESNPRIVLSDDEMSREIHFFKSMLISYILPLFHSARLEGPFTTSEHQDEDAELHAAKSIVLQVPELRGTHGIDSIAYRDDCIQIVKIYLPGDIAPTFGLNYSEIPNSCLTNQLTGFVDIFQVFIDGWHTDGKKLRHELLRQPDGFILIAGFNALLSRLPGENQKLRRAVADKPYRAFAIFFSRHIVFTDHSNK